MKYSLDLQHMAQFMARVVRGAPSLPLSRRARNLMSLALRCEALQVMSLRVVKEVVELILVSHGWCSTWLSMIQWIRTSRLSITKSIFLQHMAQFRDEWLEWYESPRPEEIPPPATVTHCPLPIALNPKP